MYRFESGSRLPFIVIFPFILLRMSTYLSSNSYWRPCLQKVSIDRKDLSRPGKRCDFCASMGGSGLDSSDLWVDVIFSQFAMRMGSEMTADFVLSHGHSRVG